MADREYCGFVWDEKKAADNIKNHKVSFEVAARIFSDPCLYIEYDEKHSTEGEERFKNLGMVDGNIVFAVWSTEKGDKTRLITARKATKKERDFYAENAKALQAH